MDAERVASLLDGRVRGAERDELLERLVASDDDFHAFADTAAVLREAEPEEPPRRIAAASTLTPDDVPRLRDELERVACELARLLREPVCDEEGLWRLDACARELGRRLRSAAARGAALPRTQAAVARATAWLFCGG